MSLSVLDAEKQFIEAAKRNDVETMRSVGRGVNANAKNVVGSQRMHKTNTALIRVVSCLY